MTIKNELNKILKLKKIFNFDKKKKSILVEDYFNNLTRFHYKNCDKYMQICKKFSYSTKKNYNISELPFLPVNLFKKLDLSSVKKTNILRTMVSSGTTGQVKSKIFLDSLNSKNQIRALNKLYYESNNLINVRAPMLIIDFDNLSNLKKNNFSARSAATIGFSIFSSERVYALNENMSLNIKNVKNFLKRNSEKQKIIIGLTSLVWEKFLSDKEILKLNFKNSILYHGGGWKKLENLNITNLEFKKKIKQDLKIDKVINYYGMVEQTGSIFFECEQCSNFVTSIYSDIIIRDKNLNDVGQNSRGMIQLLSVLPTSYPGHNILTEDEGVILGEDDCRCGRLGKRFKVFGRLKKSELRGCSDAIS